MEIKKFDQAILSIYCNINMLYLSYVMRNKLKVFHKNQQKERERERESLNKFQYLNYVFP